MGYKYVNVKQLLIICKRNYRIASRWQYSNLVLVSEMQLSD